MCAYIHICMLVRRVLTDICALGVNIALVMEIKSSKTFPLRSDCIV